MLGQEERERESVIYICLDVLISKLFDQKTIISKLD